jgi:hypothetical protein
MSFVRRFAPCALLAVASISAAPGALSAQPRSPGAADGPAAATAHREAPNDPFIPSPRPLRTGPIHSAAGVQRGTSVFFTQVNVAEGPVNIFGDAANEPSIAVDPTKPNRIAIGWRQFDTTSSDFRQAGRAFSRDAGRTWTNLSVLTPGTFRSDPVLAAGPYGTFYYNSLRSNFLTDVFISVDGGLSWPTMVHAYGGDKAWMVVDYTDGIGRGNIYAAWSSNAACCGNRTFTRSTDGGRTWLNPITIPNNPIFGTTAVGPDGAVYVAGVNPGNFSQFRVSKSSNAQDPTVAPTFDFTVNVDMAGSMSFATGPNPVGLLGQANIAVDCSGGPNHGNVYLLCSVDPPNSDPLNVKFRRSTNGGSSWDPVKTINTDAATGSYQWFGTLSVAPNGRIDVVWNDNRFNIFQQNAVLFYSYSTDGGLTFSPNDSITLDFNPFLGYPQQQKIGDYYHMVSDNVGANLAFAATFNNEQDVYFMRIGDFDCNGNGVGDADDLAAGNVTDFNANNVPDVCDAAGDLNCDGIVNADDVGPLALALVDEAAYFNENSDCSELTGDVDGNGEFDARDLALFVRVLLNDP